jgi:hypothetical protein
MSKKYRKKSDVIEAYKYGEEEAPQWFKEAVRKGLATPCSQYGGTKRWCEIETKEGTMIAKIGDYIVKDVDVDLFPCKPHMFETIYEVVEKE